MTVTLNGAPLATDFTLTNAGTSFPVTYRTGRNVLVVRALNEGSLVANTAAVDLTNVVSGPATQTYGLNTGGTVQLTITFDPAARGTGLNYSRTPPPATKTRCDSNVGSDCRP